MNGIYLIKYSVKGIKTLDQLITLSFYKKTITKKLDIQNYNLKGIYGMNGSGKSAIITSVKILKNILVDPDYLNNPIVQKNLEEIINKKTKELYITTDYLINVKNNPLLFRYSMTLKKNSTEKYIILNESLKFKNATSRNDKMNCVFEIQNGKINSFNVDEDNKSFREQIKEKTTNLLETASFSSLVFEKILINSLNNKNKKLRFTEAYIALLYFFGYSIHVYLDEADDHRDYITETTLERYQDRDKYQKEIKELLLGSVNTNNNDLTEITITKNYVRTSQFEDFKKSIRQLQEFLQIFKPDLKEIDIDKKENKDILICDLIMNYGDYKIHAEYESTGIKKLIKLFVYLKEMVSGSIVFIDEFDSNLHDVYLCALLEYLMEYGKGQLCFTTHNVGPMDVLKKRRKSIEFLSEDHKIYSWTINGNYSPSKLYRSGMIEGSPFNVDSIDFINIFGYGEEME